MRIDKNSAKSRRFNSLLITASGIALGLLVSGCSTDLTRFEVLNIGGNTTTGTHQITRAEVADQGSGEAERAIVGPSGHTMTKVTVGGSYLRTLQVGAPTGAYTGSGYRINAGLHGNPLATQ